MNHDILKHAIGQKLSMIKEKDDEVWLVFDDDVIIIRFPSFDCRCLDCIDKERKIDGNK